MEWSYSANVHRQKTIERVAEKFSRALVNLIDHCSARDAGYTPSDFAAARISENDLTKLIARLQ
jgi:non-ribosomal peptide synthase protein (TIGR01720 family)